MSRIKRAMTSLSEIARLQRKRRAQNSGDESRHGISAMKRSLTAIIIFITLQI